MSERNDTPHKIAEVLRAIAGKKDKKYFTSAIILAAGSSTRMQGGSKQFLCLDGMPVVARTISVFDKSDCIDEIIVVAKKDEIIFVHKYYVHSFEPKTEYNKYVLIISANYAEDIDKILKNETLSPKLSDTEYNRTVIKPILDKLYSEKDMHRLVKKGYVNVLIGHLFDNYPSSEVKTSANIEIMVDILHYVNDHYKEPLTLDSVAAAFGYNKCYFSRIFNKYIGENLSNYVNVVRLQNFMREAQRLENPKISAIAAECGFSSMPTFYRAFEKIYGESPKKYFASR